MKRGSDTESASPRKHTPEPERLISHSFFDLAELYCKMTGCNQHTCPARVPSANSKWTPQTDVDIENAFEEEMERRASLMKDHEPIVRFTAIHECGEHYYFNVRANDLNEEELRFVMQFSGRSFTDKQYTFVRSEPGWIGTKLYDLATKFGLNETENDDGSTKKPVIESIDPEGHMLLASVMACGFD